MVRTEYRDRRAAQVENAEVRVTVLEQGGHVAQILHKASGVNPLWTPPWPSLEPASFDPAKHSEYGGDAESKLLAGIMGHNLCLDIFGGPSAEEAAAGLTVHGEASIAPYQMEADGDGLVARAFLPEARLKVERRIRLSGDTVRFAESVENVSATDRPVGWTQHVTLGPPFLVKGATQFRASGARSKVFEQDFAGEKGFLKPGAEFDWPLAPRKDGSVQDLQILTDAPSSGGFSTTLMDPRREAAYFLAFTPSLGVLFGYEWKRADFPWLGIWQENFSREAPPWGGKTLTIGMEFGASPMPEGRRAMIERGHMFGTPGFRWIPARSKVEVEYQAFVRKTSGFPEPL
ncbi:MAG: hypothetical protein KIT09_05165 [Bryobacteraceae bacterium]|nr:hypothetical protein [Bryobacteraceae bacterium]